MEIKTWAGRVKNLDNNLEGWGSKCTSELLINALCNYARKNRKFYQATDGDLLLTYTERSLQSILFSSLNDAGAVVFSEEPIRRKSKGQRETHGWVDLWAYYRKLSYIIETKHDGVAWRSGIIRKSTVQLWKDDIKKLKSITPGSLEDSSINSQGISKIALLTLRIYQSSKDPEKLSIIEANEVYKFGKQVSLSLRQEVSWGAVWALSPYLQEPQKRYDNKYISYPGLLLLAWVDGPH